jgi:dienelactone hydrolase
VPRSSSATANWLQQLAGPPPFQVPPTRAAWLTARRRIRRRLWALLGDLPPRPRRLAPRLISRDRWNGCTVERFTFDNGAGATVPGCLVLPDPRPGARLPAVLYSHWHGDEYDVGKEEVFRRDHTPDTPADALARQGCAVLAIDAYGFGERAGQGPGGPAVRGHDEEQDASKFNLWAGRTLWGMMLRDDLLALDYLSSRAEIDPRRIGAAGISMGATRTWWLMALDERIAAGVSVACLTRYTSLIAHGALGAHGLYYYVPGMLQHFDTEAIVALLAPRPALFLTGDADRGSPADGVRAIAAAARRVYRLYGREAAFKSRVYPGVGHACTPEMWRQLLMWMARRLIVPET